MVTPRPTGAQVSAASVAPSRGAGCTSGWPAAGRGPVPADPYLVCGTPRTGSTLLRGLLAATGVAGKPESYFRLPDVRSYAETWGAQVGPDGPLDNGGYVRAAMAVSGTGNGVVPGIRDRAPVHRRGLVP